MHDLSSITPSKWAVAMPPRTRLVVPPMAAAVPQRAVVVPHVGPTPVAVVLGAVEPLPLTAAMAMLQLLELMIQCFSTIVP
jgi:hypothetical protein